MRKGIWLWGFIILGASAAWADLGVVQKVEKDRLELVVFQKDLYVGARVALEDFRESRDRGYRIQGEVIDLSKNGYRSTILLFPQEKQKSFLPGQVLYLRVIRKGREKRSSLSAPS